MKLKEKNQQHSLEGSLIRALRLIDSQISREMLRSPAQREEHGVTKWEPMSKRTELLTSTFLDHLGDHTKSDQEFSIESLLVVAQAIVKSLSLIAQDLGEEQLGTIKTWYFKDSLAKINFDVERANQALGQVGEELTQ
jgi:hypothetical protein